jgi:hypothetical protein
MHPIVAHHAGEDVLFNVLALGGIWLAVALAAGRVRLTAVLARLTRAWSQLQDGGRRQHQDGAAELDGGQRLAEDGRGQRRGDHGLEGGQDGGGRRAGPP